MLPDDPPAPLGPVVGEYVPIWPFGGSLKAHVPFQMSISIPHVLCRTARKMHIRSCMLPAWFSPCRTGFAVSKNSWPYIALGQCALRISTK